MQLGELIWCGNPADVTTSATSSTVAQLSVELSGESITPTCRPGGEFPVNESVAIPLGPTDQFVRRLLRLDLPPSPPTSTASPSWSNTLIPSASTSPSASTTMTRSRGSPSPTATLVATPSPIDTPSATQTQTLTPTHSVSAVASPSGTTSTTRTIQKTTTATAALTRTTTTAGTRSLSVTLSAALSRTATNDRTRSESTTATTAVTLTSTVERSTTRSVGSSTTVSLTPPLTASVTLTQSKSALSTTISTTIVVTLTTSASTSPLPSPTAATLSVSAPASASMTAPRSSTASNNVSTSLSAFATSTASTPPTSSPTTSKMMSTSVSLSLATSASTTAPPSATASNLISTSLSVSASPPASLTALLTFTSSLEVSVSMTSTCVPPNLVVHPKVVRSIDLKNRLSESFNITLVGNDTGQTFLSDLLQSHITISADHDWLRPSLVPDSVVLASGGKSVALRILSPFETMKVYESGSIRVHFAKEAFSCNTGEGAAVVIPLRPVPRPVPREAVVVIESIGVTTAAVSSVIGTPTIAVQQSRIAAVMSLSSCRFSHNEPLDPFLSPLGWRVGDATGSYYRGALVGNFVIFLGVLVLSAFFTLLLYNPSAKANRGVIDAMRLLHLPGLWAVPIALLCQGTVSVATSLYNHGSHPIDRHLCWTTATIVILLWAAVMYLVTVGFRCESTERPSVRHDPTQPAWRRWLIVCVFSSTKWRDKPKVDAATGKPVHRGFKQHWQALFIDYRDGYQWFFGFEMSLAIVVGIIEGVKEPSMCDEILWVFLAVIGLQTAAAMFMQPFAAPFNTFFHIFISVGTCAAVGLGAAARFLDGDDTESARHQQLIGASQWCALVLQVFSVFKLAFDFLMLFRWFHSRYLRHRQDKIVNRMQAFSRSLSKKNRHQSCENDVGDRSSNDESPSSLVTVLFDWWASASTRPSFGSSRRRFADAVEDFDEDLELLLLQSQDSISADPIMVGEQSSGKPFVPPSVCVELREGDDII